MQFKEVFLTPRFLGIAMEYAGGGDMFEFFVRNKVRQKPALPLVMAEQLSGACSISQPCLMASKYCVTSLYHTCNEVKAPQSQLHAVMLHGQEPYSYSRCTAEGRFAALIASILWKWHSDPIGAGVQQQPGPRGGPGAVVFPAAHCGA